MTMERGLQQRRIVNVGLVYLYILHVVFKVGAGLLYLARSDKAQTVTINFNQMTHGKTRFI